MYLRQDGTDLWGTSALSRGDIGGVFAKPQSGEVNVLPERSDKFGATHAINTNTIGAPSTIAAPSSEILVNGVILPGETDAYGFNLVAGQTYMFSVYGSGGTPLPDTFMYIVDNTFTNVLGFDDDGGAGVNSLITYTATYTGLHVLAIEGFSASQTGGYTFDAIVKPPTDVVPDTFAGASPLTIGTVKYGFIDAGPDGPYGPGFGEVDTYSFTVEAGMFYSFEVAGGADYNSDPFDLPPGEIDSVLVIYDSQGNLVTLDDDINFANGDIGSSVGFLATQSGTYYLDVFSYQPWSGGFTITSSAIDPSLYDPLDSINWVSANNVPFDETNTAYVYFAVAGESFGETADNGIDPLPSFGWTDFEKQQVMLALEEYSKVLGVNYEITTDSSEATFRLITTTSEQYGAYMYPQDPAFGDAQGIAAFNVDSGGWGAFPQSLEQGGYSFWTILHEFGHGHGLAHPHDRGGGSEIMLGVTAAQGSYGIYDLNQAVYTVMSYNGSWETGPNGESPFTIAGISNGWQGTLSAFDIAALQERYGANMHYAEGDDTYVIKDTQGVGTYYQTIWDTNGKDTIKYDGNRNARIDLTAATLDYSPTGGGVMSFVTGVFGGFTIAAGVVIENATGGNGSDVLIGNAAANTLTGNGGDDVLVGRAGGDKLDGGAGFDTANYADSGAAVRITMGNNGSGTGSGGDAQGDTLKSIEAVVGSAFNDTLTGGNSNDTFSGGDGNDNITGGNGNDTLSGGAGNDRLEGGNGNDSMDGGDGNDTMRGDNGVDTMSGGAGNDTMEGGNDADSMTGGAGNDTMRGDNGIDTLDGGADNDSLDGGNDNDSLAGGLGNDNLSGGNGVDVLTGGAGNDSLTGGNARDHFVFGSVDGVDLITDFKKNQDLIDLRPTDLVWSDLDSNGNNRLDDGDAFVSVTAGDTIIDLGLADGGVSGLNTVRVDNVINLTDDSFLFG
jgi:serralysin